MNKKLLPIIIILSIILSLSIFVACDKEVEDPHQFLNVKLTDGTNTDTWINVQYQYGQTLDIFDTLQIVLEYKDGSVTLTSESPEANEVKITYSDSNGTEIEAFSKNSVLAPGNYQVTVSDKGSMATLSVYISQADFKDNYKIYIKDASTEGKPNTSQYEFGSDNMTVALYTQAGAELNKNLINSLYALTPAEKQAYDALEDETAKKDYLMAHYSNSIGLDFETGTIVTTMLLPGDYYMFALINSTETEVSGYTKPTNFLQVKKGKIVLTNDFVLNTIAAHGEYTFNNYVAPGEEPKMTKDGTKALSLMEVGINFDEDHDSITIEGGTYDLGMIGTFAFTDTTARVDAANNGQTKQVKFTLLDYFNERYIVTTSQDSTLEARWNIPLQIERAKIHAPYFNGDLQDNTVNVGNYNGSVQDVDPFLQFDYDSFVNLVGNKQTNAGNYNAIYSLKDDINYMWDRDTNPNYYYGQCSDLEKGNITFAWKITKAPGLVLSKITYLGNTLDEKVVQFERNQVNNKSISVELYSDYIDAVLAEGVEIEWSYEVIPGVTLTLDTTKTSNTNTVTFTSLTKPYAKGNYDYINIGINIGETSNYSAYEDLYYGSCTIHVIPAEFTADEVEAAYVGLPAEFVQIDNEYLYCGGTSSRRKLDVYGWYTSDPSNIDYYTVPIPNAIVYNSNTLGSWRLYHSDGTNPEDVEVVQNQHITTADFDPTAGIWYFVFESADGCTYYYENDFQKEIKVITEGSSLIQVQIASA